MVSRSKIEFFDSNPVGRILTRFSKDLSLLELLMPNSSILASYGIFRTFATCVILSVINYWLLIPVAIFVMIVYYIVRRVAHILVEA